MLNNELKHALVYIAVILSLYVTGLILLLLHYVWKKNGQISCYDIYLELMPISSDIKTSHNEAKESASHNDKTSTPSSGNINHITQYLAFDTAII